MQCLKTRRHFEVNGLGVLPAFEHLRILRIIHGRLLIKIVGYHLFNHSGIGLWHHIALHMR